MDDPWLTKSRDLIKKNDALSSIICGIERHLLMCLRHLLMKAERSFPLRARSSF
jgi:hypothetical protein